MDTNNPNESNHPPESKQVGPEAAGPEDKITPETPVPLPSEQVPEEAEEATSVPEMIIQETNTPLPPEEKHPQKPQKVISSLIEAGDVNEDALNTLEQASRLTEKINSLE